jgi:hypothetical protein
METRYLVIHTRMLEAQEAFHPDTILSNGPVDEVLQEESTIQVQCDPLPKTTARRGHMRRSLTMALVAIDVALNENTKGTTATHTTATHTTATHTTATHTTATPTALRTIELHIPGVGVNKRAVLMIGFPIICRAHNSARKKTKKALNMTHTVRVNQPSSPQNWVAHTPGTQARRTSLKMKTSLTKTRSYWTTKTKTTTRTQKMSAPTCASMVTAG